MVEPSIVTWYMSTRLPAPVEELTPAFDRLSPEVKPPPAGAGNGPTPGSSAAFRMPVRRLRTRLRLRGWGPTVPVEIELEAWSQDESELGIRPVRRRPPAWRATRYFKSAKALLEDLGGWLLLGAARRHASYRDLHRACPRPFAVGPRCAGGARRGGQLVGGWKERIPGATYVELDEGEHSFRNRTEPGTRPRHRQDPDRVLATVLFTDIVSSTEQLAQLGDHQWRVRLDDFRQRARRELERHRGCEIGTRGDDFLATFDGPARAVRCATAIRESARPLGIEVRSGLHTGELDATGSDVAGIAVHIGARVAALARPGEVLVSRTVVDLVAGSGLQFDDRGGHTLKGVPGEWQLFAAGS